jgi:hypothetical protein
MGIWSYFRKPPDMRDVFNHHFRRPRRPDVRVFTLAGDVFEFSAYVITRVTPRVVYVIVVEQSECVSIERWESFERRVRAMMPFGSERVRAMICGLGRLDAILRADEIGPLTYVVMEQDRCAPAKKFEYLDAVELQQLEDSLNKRGYVVSFF